jgi:hypothetical protein
MTQTMQAPTTTAQPQAAQPRYIITDDDKKRIKANQAAWKAYKGDLEPPLKVLDGQLDDNVMENRIAPVVLAGVYFLFGKELEISVDDGAPTEAQDFLNKTWGRKETRIPLLMKLAMNGANGRNAFLRIVPSADKPGRQQTFRLIPVDPAIVVGVETAPQDCDTVLLYCIQYSRHEMINGKQMEVFYREEISRIDPDGNALKGMPDDDDTWSIAHWTQVATSPYMDPKQNAWTPAGEPYTWNYPFPPMYMCQNLPLPNDPWGEPDTTDDLIGMNESLNFTSSNTQKTIKLYGHPFIYMTGGGDGDLPTAPGRIASLPDGSTMGAVQFTTDIPNAIAFGHDIRSSMDERSHVPAVATGRIEAFPRGQMSGITMELFFMSILKKTDAKRCTYGEMIIDVSKSLLKLGGYSEDIEIELAWQNPLPTDNLADAQYAVLLMQIGISQATIQRNLGFDPEEELELSQAEDQAKLDAFSKGMGMPPPGMPGMAPQMPGQPMPGQAPPGQPGGQP